MKSRIASYLAGVLTVVLIGTFSVSALASDGALTLTAHPIHILVNGEVFKPKDAAGNDVLVFVYNGTTYAPLRALAETYGLEVGYDAASNTATVTGTAGQNPTAPAGDFISQWTVKEKPVTNYGDEKIFCWSLLVISIFNCVGFSGDGFSVDGFPVVGFSDNGESNNGWGCS